MFKTFIENRIKEIVKLKEMILSDIEKLQKQIQQLHANFNAAEGAHQEATNTLNIINDAVSKEPIEGEVIPANDLHPDGEAA